MRLPKTLSSEAAPIVANPADVPISHSLEASPVDGQVDYVPSGKAMPLRANFSWTLLGNIVYAGCQWAMLIVLARVGRSEMVGQFALGLALTAPVLMCCNLNLRSVQATDARREYSFSDYLNLRLVSTVCALLVILGIGVFSGYRGATLAVVLLIGAAKGIEAISDVFFGLLQQNEQMRPIAISMMMKGGLSLMVLAATLYLTASLVAAVLAMCVIWALVLVFYDMPVSAQLLAESAAHKDLQVNQSPSGSSQWLIKRSSIQVAIRLVWLAAPMGIVMFLISLNSNIPRYFIERQLGLHELGIFAAITYLMTAGGTVVGALGQSATPRLSNLFAAGKRTDFSALLWKLTAVSSIIGIGGLLVAMFFGRQVLGLVYGNDYVGHVTLFIGLMAVAWLSYLSSLLGYGMSAARYFRVQAPIYLAAVLVTLLGSWLLIPGYGLIGAVMAIGAGTLVQLLAGMVVVALALRTAAPIEPVEVKGSA